MHNHFRFVCEFVGWQSRKHSLRKQFPENKSGRGTLVYLGAWRKWDSGILQSMFFPFY